MYRTLVRLNPKNFKINLKELRMARGKFKKPGPNPCRKQFEKLFIAMERTNSNYMLMWPVVKELDKCMAAHSPKKMDAQEKKSTMYMLSKYLDRGRR